MAIYTVTINPGSNSQPASIHGSVGWSGDVSHVQTLNMNPGAGSTWIIWQIGATGIPSGEPVNAVRVSGTHFFNVYGGGGYARICTLYAKSATTLAGITGSGDGIASVHGNANTVALSAGIATPVGLTSTQLLAGQFYLGYAVKTGSDQPLFGPGVYSTTGLTFKFYTGADNPNPPPNQVYGTLTNPSGNTSPGQPSGGQFAGLTFQYLQPIPKALLTITWVTSNAGLTFSSNGSTTMSQAKGTTNDPANPYIATCPPINIAPTLAGGVYGVNAGFNVAEGSLVLSANLTVLANTNQGFFMEF